MSGRRGPILARLRTAAASAATLAIACGSGAPDVQLVLILSVDTLRADRLGAHGSVLGLTPHLDALGAESLVFDAAYAPSAHTLPSIAALMTRRYPQELRREMGLDAGFDHFDDALPELEAARPMPERLGPDTTRAALAALDLCLPGRRARCLLWVHYQDPHGPYTPPAELRAERLAEERRRPDAQRELPVLTGSYGSGGIPDYQVIDGRRDVAFYRAGYDGEVALLDAEIGNLLGAIRARGLWERTLVVFAADHGESLGEDDLWFGHGERLSEVQVRVPLWIRVPGTLPGSRTDVTSLLDVAPTLEALLLGTPSGPEAPGRDLLAPEADQRSSTVYLATLQGSRVRRIGVIDGDFKYLAELRDESSWDGRLTRRGADDVDLTAPAPHVAGRLRARLEELVQRYEISPERRAELDAEDRRKLRALGYLEGDSP